MVVLLQLLVLLLRRGRRAGLLEGRSEGPQAARLLRSGRSGVPVAAPGAAGAAAALVGAPLLARGRQQRPLRAAIPPPGPPR